MDDSGVEALEDAAEEDMPSSSLRDTFDALAIFLDLRNLARCLVERLRYIAIGKSRELTP